MSACRNKNFSKQWKSTKKWSGNYKHMKKIEVGILGATGMVGQHFIKFLDGHPLFRAHVAGRERTLRRQALLRSREMASGRRGPRRSSQDRTVEEAKPGNAPKLLFSAMDASVATEIEQAFAQAGHVVVSNSQNHRMDRDVPLLVPEINPDHLKLIPGQQRARGWKGQIVTNPNCSTIVLTMALGAAEAVRHHARSSPPPCRPFPARAIRACLRWTSSAT